MATYTENFSLIKPDDEDYYDVADFNENMDIIDEALAENTGSADKIGQPEDSVLDTVFGKLNGFISADGQGVRIIKSIQRKVGGGSTKTFEINPVIPSRCIVLTERMHDTSSSHSHYSYTLTANALNVSISSGSGQATTIGFWIIEFY